MTGEYITLPGGVLKHHAECEYTIQRNEIGTGNPPEPYETFQQLAEAVCNCGCVQQLQQLDNN